MSPPADSASLLVPVHLDAWVVDESNQELVSWYLPDYENLEQFVSPMPNAFDVSSGKPTVGVHLHWALPDALTSGTSLDGKQMTFPLVPNRWLVARLSPGPGGRRVAKLWVVESDRLRPAGSPGGSPFLDPFAPTAMTAQPGAETKFAVQSRTLGASYTVEAWEARTDPDGPLHLTAVGPGDVSFAAYVPQVQDVFAFVDNDAPTAGTGLRAYTYMVVGWYSNPEQADPLRGVGAWDPAHWPEQGDWSALSPTARFGDVMSALQWSVTGEVGNAPPSTSLYHGTVVGVQWPCPTLGNAGIDTNAVRVAVGNTGIEALAALIQAYARAHAGSDPAPDDAWLVAGDTLAGLVEAAAYDALSDFGKPGGAALVEQRVRDAWFGSAEGGTDWRVVAATPEDAGDPSPGPVPGPDVLAQLAALNADQQRLDEAELTLATRRQALYGMWLRVGRANSFEWGQTPATVPAWEGLKSFLEDDLYPQVANAVWDLACEVATMRASLPDPSDPAAATAWADERWRLTSADGKPASLSDLGLQLKGSSRARFRHPTDPVVLVSGAARARKHGEDGRFTEDGTLRCRLPGETVNGLTVGATTVTLEQLGLDPAPFDAYEQIPNVRALAAEAYLADPANAQPIAQAGGLDPKVVAAAIEGLLDGSAAAAAEPNSEAGSTDAAAAWVGSAPAPFALRAWDQAWAPLFLEWEVSFYPTGAGKGPARSFALGDWAFDGSDFAWGGTGFDGTYSIPYRGRARLTPQAPMTFQARIADYLKRAPEADTDELEALLAAVDDWDVLSQSLSGFNDQLITLLSQETFPPPPAESDVLPCPRPAQSAPTPDPAVLIGDGYRHAPMLEGTGLNVNYFHPVRGGFAKLVRLQIVDAFGQTLVLSRPNTPQGFQPVVAGALQPADPKRALPVGAFQLAPRVVQPARLEFKLVPSADGGTICGWLLPNHIDRAIAVYDHSGLPLGEVRVADPPHSWRPRPGPPGEVPAPATPEAIEDPVLRAAIASIAAQPGAVIGDVLTTIDEALWMVDPLGGRKDQFLSVLIGRPIAVVQATLQLGLSGDAATNQLWDYTAEANPSPPPAYRWRQDTGGIAHFAFPVRLGELELREDGLLGYWLPEGDYSRLYVPHVSVDASAGGAYVQPIVTHGPDGAPAYRGDIELSFGGAPVMATLLIDPRGAVHAYTGILPVTSTALPGHLVDDLVKGLAVTFDAGPVIAEPAAMRMPLPSRRQSAWQWIQSTPGGWTEEPVLDADDIARLSGAPTELREGWLRFSDAEEEPTGS
jgi:hypothetical protein